jgi:hypothetical protein
LRAVERRAGKNEHREYERWGEGLTLSYRAAGVWSTELRYWDCMLFARQGMCQEAPYEYPRCYHEWMPGVTMYVGIRDCCTMAIMYTTCTSRVNNNLPRSFHGHRQAKRR